MDTTVKRIRPKDYELSTVQDNLANQIDALTSKFNGSTQPQQIILSPKLQQLYGKGTPYSMQQPALQVNGDPQATGGTSVLIGTAATATAPQLNANTRIYGNVYIYSATGNGVVIQPPVSGPAFYVTNTAGNQALFIINADGSTQCYAVSMANSFNSAAGFKNTIPVGTYWNSSYSANNQYQLQTPVINSAGGSSGLTPVITKFTHAGSVVGMSLNQAGPITGSNYLYIYKNGNLVYTWNAGAGSNNATFWGTQPKGAIPFAAGDTLSCSVSNTASGNTQVLAYLTLEMSA